MVRETLLQVLDEQRLRFADPRVAKEFSRWNKTMQYHFTDRGEYYLVRFVEGQAQPPTQEQVPKPEQDFAAITGWNSLFTRLIMGCWTTISMQSVKIVKGVYGLELQVAFLVMTDKTSPITRLMMD